MDLAATDGRLEYPFDLFHSFCSEGKHNNVQCEKRLCDCDYYCLPKNNKTMQLAEYGGN